MLRLALRGGTGEAGSTSPSLYFVGLETVFEPLLFFFFEVSFSSTLVALNPGVVGELGEAAELGLEVEEGGSKAIKVLPGEEGEVGPKPNLLPKKPLAAVVPIETSLSLVLKKIFYSF